MRIISFTYSPVLTDDNYIYRRPLQPHLTSHFWEPGHYSLAKLACKTNCPNTVLLDVGHSHLLPLFPSCHPTHWVEPPMLCASWAFAICSSRGLESSTAFLCVLSITGESPPQDGPVHTAKPFIQACSVWVFKTQTSWKFLVCCEASSHMWTVLRQALLPKHSVKPHIPQLPVSKGLLHWSVNLHLFPLHESSVEVVTSPA